MPSFPAPIESRLPSVGTTIFTVMSRLAQECGAINLSQGFPDFNAEDVLFERVAHWMRAGHNQYAPMAGCLPLREAIAAKVATLYGTAYNVESEVTVTAGATQALFTAVTALVRPGDEVIVFEPVYDSYVPAIELAGGRAVRMRLAAPDYRPDWDAVAAAVGPRTRMIMINSPHNPTATVWSAADLERLAAITRGTGIVVVSDEVYEHIVFDGRRHVPLITLPGMRERSLKIASAGKTFALTGWKVGMISAAPGVLAPVAKAHQFLTFTTPPNLQEAVAYGLGKDDSYFNGMTAALQAKRDRFATGLRRLGLTVLDSQGTYFVNVDLASTGFNGDDEAFCRHIIETVGVAAIPVSAFCPASPLRHVVRFCFCKRDEVLDAALDRLAGLMR